MKTLINFSISPDDLSRYQSSDDLRCFYEQYGCSGLELMPVDGYESDLIRPDMVLGVHTCCIHDWMDRDLSFLLEHYRKDLDFAHRTGAEYVVFHVTQVCDDECLGRRFYHTDQEVTDAAARLINLLLDDTPYTFHFLMENLWWPGLNLLDETITCTLLERVHYERKGLMLDTGHFLHTDPALADQQEALACLHSMLDRHSAVLPYIKGIHLHQSLYGEDLRRQLLAPPAPAADPKEKSLQAYGLIFAVDRHLPFTIPEVRTLVQRIDPLYVTYEYISRNREEHAGYLEAGSRALQGLS